MLQLASRKTYWAGLCALARRLAGADPAPALDYPFVRSDIALHYRHLAGARSAIDDQTWSEMLLDQYADALAPECSIFGRQILHRRLREGMDAEHGETQAGRVRALLQDPQALRQLGAACHCLRQAETQVSDVLFADAIPLPPRWAGQLWLLPCAFLACVAIALLWGPAWCAALALWTGLMAVQMRFYHQAQEWERQTQALQQQLRAHSLLAALDAPLASGFAQRGALAGQLNRALARSPMLALTPLARDYADWFLLANVKRYFKSATLVARERDFLRQSFLLVASLEADLALARHLLQAPAFCWAGRSATGTHLTFEHVVHPLLEQAAPLSLALDGKGAFISGQNGIGKSTLLRTLGINCIVARAFGFCYAASAQLTPMAVYSSMQGEDTLTGGESLYIAELRRARELLALAEAGPPALFIIDEIFRGTNHLESISAAAAVLHTLSAAGLVVVASHNLVLAPLLEDSLIALCVSAPDGDAKQLCVVPGVLADTNGLRLLASRGFGAQIEDKAGKVFAWLSGYLAHPADGAGVLRDG